MHARPPPRKVILSLESVCVPRSMKHCIVQIRVDSGYPRVSDRLREGLKPPVWVVNLSILTPNSGVDIACVDADDQICSRRDWNFVHVLAIPSSDRCRKGHDNILACPMYEIRSEYNRCTYRREPYFRFRVRGGGYLIGK